MPHNTQKRSSIRKSTLQDLRAVRTWLEEEEAQGVHGNFLCNWSVIEQAHRDRELLVMIDGPTGLPVAFQLGGLLQSGILQVRNDHRGKGLGRRMVEHCIKRALSKDERLLSIQCKPSTSIPFWERMGFSIFSSSDGTNYGYRVIEKVLPLPESGSPASVVIRFYPESKKWADDTQPYVTHSPKAKSTSVGIVKLGARVLFHEHAGPEVGDVVVEVKVDGRSYYLDKAKYEEAARIGFKRCKNGWYVDELALPSDTDVG